MGKHKKGRRRTDSTSKWYKPHYNQHHRLPKSRGGTNATSNLSRVPVRLHNAFNELFGSNPTAHEVAQILSDVWIDFRYVITVKLRGEQDNHSDNISDADAASAQRIAFTS